LDSALFYPHELCHPNAFHEGMVHSTVRVELNAAREFPNIARRLEIRKKIDGLLRDSMMTPGQKNGIEIKAWLHSIQSRLCLAAR
jgi:hypothetical protein